MVSSNARAYGGDPIAQHRTAIDAAKASGVRRILYTSQISASPTSAFNPGLDHAKTEELLRDSGVAFTSLRNGFYASHAAGVVANAIKKGELVVPENGKLSWTAHKDLAEAAAVILLAEGRFDGATPPLTGAEALDFADLAALASEVAGREIKYSTLSDDDYIAHSMKAGLPERVARFGLGMFVAARRGEFAKVDPTLQELIGHAPATLHSLIARP
jgi:NAD(P)H dehydrogenase (quinone)